MKEKFTILIADRNHNVRDFLRREMIEAGYNVQVAKNSQEILEWVNHHDLVDLLILDPDMPDTGDTAMMKMLKERISPLPVVVHSILADHANYSDILKNIVFVEKMGNSIERLKEVVSGFLGSPDQKSPNTSEDNDAHSII